MSELEKTQASEEDIRAALEEVMDPEILLSVIDLGLIKNVRVGGPGEVTEVDMLLTTPFCPYAPMMVENVTAAVEKVTGGKAKVEILPDAWDQSMMPDPSLLGHW